MMKTVSEIRQAFLKFFAARNHAVVSSSTLVPQHDPSLLFTNAGMVQFKNVFTGTEKRPYTRATSVQKCLRAGGKHNDLENVGRTKRHHTFFEMLGNFSFGDYFKEQAILYAWEFLTQTLSLPKDRLYITVHTSDTEAAQLWKKIASLADERIIRIDSNDNFWMMGETGPCGPCTEIFYDHGSSLAGGLPGSPEQDGDRYVEIWNLVFMAFEQINTCERIALPKPCVDTGVGLERLAAVLQHKSDNYDIDLMRNLIEASAQLSHTQPDDEHVKVSHRIIADHIRAMSFLIADGILPSNEGRSYVLRRIMRRAMRHTKLLGVKKPMLASLAPILVDLMKEAYPELARALPLMKEIIYAEEERFWETLGKGLKILRSQFEKLSPRKLFPGEIAFMLYDTYGFPLDLTEDILHSAGFTLEKESFDKAMRQQQETSRQAWTGSGEKSEEEQWIRLASIVPATHFLGYETEEEEGLVLKIIDTYLVCNQTPFYAEQGGQVGDKGLVLLPNGEKIPVLDVQKRGDLYVHQLAHASKNLREGEKVQLKVDHTTRQAIRANHSATHLLHAALKKNLGAYVQQKGSLVEADKLRFDFNHPKALTREQIDDIEENINRIIWDNLPTQAMVLPKEEALKKGALALFGEKYPDQVRVLKIGEVSLELCGGIHVQRTGDIGLFKITSEGSIASGIRRLEAVTGQRAYRLMQENSRQLEHVAHLLKVSPSHIVPTLTEFLENKRAIEQKVTHLRCENALLGGLQSQHTFKNGDLWVYRVDDIETKDFSILLDKMKDKIKTGLILLISQDSSTQKGRLILGVTKDLTSHFQADFLLKQIMQQLGLQGGGGRADMSQAGIPPSHFDHVEHILVSLMTEN